MSRTITKQEAITKLGLTNWEVDDYLMLGYPPLNIKPQFTTELNATSRPRHRFPQSILKRIVRHRRQANEDLVPISRVLKNSITSVLVDGRTHQLKQPYKFSKRTLYGWTEQCILLGRPLGHDYLGRREMLNVSQSDLQTIARMLANPIGWKLPGNSGVWLEKGIYQDGGALWFSPKYLEKHEISHQLWGHWIQEGLAAFPFEEHNGKPRSQEPQWPTRTNVHRGVMLVIHEQDVERILQWRKTQDPLQQLPGVKGVWLSDQIFRRDDALWVTIKWIEQTKHKSDSFLNYWNDRGLLRRRKVGRFSTTPGASKRVIVYSLEDLDELLASGAVDPEQETEPADEPIDQVQRAKRGRPRTDDKDKFQGACYRAYTNCTRVPLAVAIVEDNYPDCAPLSKSHLRLSAQRYATKHGLPYKTKI